MQQKQILVTLLILSLLSCHLMETDAKFGFRSRKPSSSRRSGSRSKTFRNGLKKFGKVGAATLASALAFSVVSKALEEAIAAARARGDEKEVEKQKQIGNKLEGLAAEAGLDIDFSYL